MSRSTFLGPAVPLLPAPPFPSCFLSQTLDHHPPRWASAPPPRLLWQGSAKTRSRGCPCHLVGAHGPPVATLTSGRFHLPGLLGSLLFWSPPAPPVRSPWQLLFLHAFPKMSVTAQCLALLCELRTFSFKLVPSSPSIPLERRPHFLCGLSQLAYRLSYLTAALVKVTNRHSFSLPTLSFDLTSDLYRQENIR